ncbi:hypothetical protein [Halopiger djelfimassiliensis]|uniref:hypothetical protein n=1 Tax=Halopiger djelfimassiliensis TaxID=1293047 RepID=UPI000677AE8F|nr:hypothetical protein [Halopiger djelfimassiliensis]
MAAEQRPLETTSTTNGRSRNPHPDVELAFEPIGSSVRSDRDASRSTSTLPARIERRRLRARIAALEHALETSERRRQAILTQYERLLDERENDIEREETSGRIVDRLFDRWR